MEKHTSQAEEVYEHSCNVIQFLSVLKFIHSFKAATSGNEEK